MVRGWLLRLPGLVIVLMGVYATSEGQTEPFADRPRIIIKDGNLIFKSANNKNVTFSSTGQGAIQVNNVDLTKLTSSGHVGDNTELDSRMTLVFRMHSAQSLQLTELRQQLEQLEENTTTLSNKVDRFIGSGSDRISNRALRRMMSKVGALTEKVNTLTQLLNQNECTSNPCRNGGTCVDSYNAFICNCPSNWEGPTCENDVNECAVYAGTTLGCQNGATCINTYGGYSCNCPPNWYGIDCSEKHDDCASASHSELCGHGTCIDEKRIQPGQPKYRCICEAGWKIPNGGMACTQDIDECSGGNSRCSQNPRVACVNIPGSFHCGPCPTGFTGNGYQCSDINECEMYNGGCSMHPFVQCINTHGSSHCGPCPNGYAGNGRVCTFSSVCSVNRGGCHPNATCVENSAITGTHRQCVCPPGFGGDGVGLRGCYPLASMSCANNPCQHGTCEMAGHSFHCVCYAGYYGSLCEREEDPCFTSPCLNGGTCVRGAGTFTCTCPNNYQGPTCAEQKRCGAYLRGSSGNLTYPENGMHYENGQSCAWVIQVAMGKVVNVTMNHFSLESSPNCESDFLQLNDGPTSASRTINRFCDDHLHGVTFSSTHNEMYMWFHSDDSHTSTGFSMSWIEANPVCGGELNETEYGSVNSPGYPGPYPSLRTCSWLVKVPVGKRIQFHFATLKLETHENCSYDYLKIFDGATDRDPVIGLYCSTITPPPLTTMGHTALLLFHSDESREDVGFHIAYSSLQSVQGCGGILTSPMGTISSPNFPDVYENNLVCEWLVRVHPDNRLLLSFEEFHVESHSNCVFDAVEIYSGVNDAAPLLGRYCGNIIPSDLFSDSHQLFVRFKSDSSLRYKGFRIKYRTICGGVFTEPSGVIMSPYYPESYPAKTLCLYEIRLQPGFLVNLTFHNVEIEKHQYCNFDYVQVRDGDKEDSPLVTQLCGTSIPDTIISTFNYLWIKFETDGSIQNKGFYAIYDSIEIGNLPNEEEICTRHGMTGDFLVLYNDTVIPGVEGCGGVLTEPQGEVASPRHPSNYPNSITCTWLLKAPAGYLVRLTFSQFRLEANDRCSFDYVLVEDTNSNPMGRYCGTVLPPILTSMDETLLVKFVTDSSISREGFTATYEFIEAKSACGGHFYQESGIIRSPGYPEYYPNNADCVWVLHAPNERQFFLNVTSFRIEKHTGCRHDFLEIRNGGYETSPLIGKFCGDEIISSIQSHSNLLFLRFRSDASTSQRGFEIYYDSTSTGCGGKMTSPRGTIVSPNYPQAYPSNANCEWLIQVSAGSVIVAHIVDIDVEEHAVCSFDYVEIYDGNNVNSKSLIRVCNMQQNSGSITSSGSSMLVRFRSDTSQEAGGFQLSYQTLCSNVLTKRTGLIESPNFPNTYPHNHNCSWTIEAPPGNNISIAFSHLLLEGGQSCNADYVEVIEVENTGEFKQLGKYCGNVTRPPGTLETASNKAIVRLITDASISEEGFRLEYRMKGCGGDFVNKDAGIITSPNFPNGYPFATVCYWHISVPPGERVQLTIDALDIEGDSECRYDYVRVFGGEDENSPRLLNACLELREPQIISSHGNKMMVTFVSDHSVAGRGFHATFTTILEGCGGLFTAGESAIMSPNFPEPYTANDECEWQIRVDSTHLVILEFYDFDIPDSRNCTRGYVAVYDGSSIEDPLLLKHCGSKPENAIQSTSNQMLVRLVADGNNVGKGFKAHYKKGCGQRLLADNGGVITSPNYPGIDLNIANCSWIIYASDPGEKVIVTVTHLNIPDHESCAYSSLILLDGDTSDAPLIKEVCGDTAHLPIVSESNTLHVFLKSYGIFRATYGIASLHCGGDYTSFQGSFGTPGYPNNYEMSMECVWTVQASMGNKVHLSFQGFSLEESEFCNNDYLEIHEEDASGTLIGKYCGHSVPSNVTAARKLWIKFRSDDVGTESGFLATYSLLHGSELRGDEGIIESPGYPEKFLKKDKYEWTIFVATNKYVSIRFLEIELFRVTEQRDCISSIMIYDGFDDQAPLLGTYCGYTIPDEAIISTSNVVFIRFESSYYYRGLFRLEWTAVTESGIVVQIPQVSPENACWEELQLNSSEQATVSSPNYPNAYPNEINCTYIIRAPHFQHVELNFTDMELERHGPATCDFDWVQVHYLMNPSVNEWTLNDTLCGQQSNRTFSSPSNILKLMFKTDKFVSGKGFSATAKPACGTVLSGPTGLLKSDYIYAGVDMTQIIPYRTFRCEYVIKVKRRRTIQLSFDSFSIPSDSVCSTNYILLRNGGSSSSPYLGNGRYCDSSTPGTLTTTSNEVYVLVMLSYVMPSPNFVIRYTEIGMGCGGRRYLTDEITSVDVMSPNYPNPPAHDIECEWVIVSPSGTRIRIDFENEFSLSPNCYEGDDVEYLEINDGGTEIAPVLHRFCGHDQPSSVMSTGNAMYLRYVTAVDNPHVGFKATVRTANCGGTIHSYMDVITSPHYPGTYGNSEECEWFLRMKSSYHILLTLTDLDTPRRYGENCNTTDYLQIRNQDATGEILGTYCGTLTNSSIVIDVPGPQAYVIFKSNSANTGRGFSMSMSTRFPMRGCGDRLEGPSGVVTSPNYPDPVLTRGECQWSILPPVGRKVRITFQEFNLPRDEVTGTCLSFLYISNISNWHISGSQRQRICGSSLPDPIDTSSGNVDVAFVTHGLGAGQGFSFTYSSEEEAVCGGLLPLPSGEIATPNFTFSQNTFVDCRWQIDGERTGNQTLVMRFDLLDIPGTRANYCRTGVLYTFGDPEYVEIFCGNYTSMVTMTSPYANTRIRFISSLENPFRGIHGTYNISNCGGQFYGNNANITSPGYPNNYSINTDCHWIINVEEGEEIKLTFLDMRLESNCNKDYVMVRNGHRLSSPLIGKFCGTQLPTPIISSGNALVVIFHSDEYGTAPGFRITTEELQTGCGGKVGTKRGNIRSPRYPSHYENNMECIWEIEYVPGYTVKLEFVGRFDLEMGANCEKDYLEIEEFKEDRGGWNLIGKKCGSSTPPTMVMKSGKVKLTFRSNDRITGDGFSINYSPVCGGNFTGMRGEIFSPNYPSLYESNLNCTYTIGKEGQYVGLIFADYFSLEVHRDCRFDYITIQQGSDTNATQGPYCGSEAPAFRTVKAPVTINFVTDSSFVAHGFLLKYETVDCGTTYTTPTGLIYSPRAASDFLDLIECDWKIVARPDRVIALRFTHFDIGTNYVCYTDYLEIRDGNETGPRIGKLCGNSSVFTVKSTGRTMTLHLRISQIHDERGFVAFYYNTYGPDSGCGGTLESSSGEIESLDADHDGNYEPNLDCNWMVIGDNVDKVFQITFDRFDVESSPNGSCLSDYLEMREDDRSGILIGRYCGSTVPSSIVTSSNKLFVLFHSNRATHKSGFKFRFTSIDSPCGQSTFSALRTSQVLTSPGYPNPYPVNLHCRWMVWENASRNYDWSRQIVQINITDIDMPCNGDFLRVQRVANRGPRQRMYREFRPYQLCGSNVHEIVIRNGFQIVFHSDAVADEARGFSLSFKIPDCNRTYTQNSGSITNTPSPERYAEDKICNITIIADRDKTISLYFMKAEFYRNGGDAESCTNNYLKFFDGTNNLAPLISTRCSGQLTDTNPVFSTGNALHIEQNLQSFYGKYHMTYMTTDQYRGCGGSIVAEMGALTSPLYPNPYNKSTECTWQLSVPGYHTMKVDILNFVLTSTTGCTSNYLEIYDGHSAALTERVARYCGNDLPASHISRNNEVMIKLVTNSSNTGSGFSLVFNSNPYLSKSSDLIQRNEQDAFNDYGIVYMV